MELDDVFSSLEARQASSAGSVLLLRASWLRARAREDPEVTNSCRHRLDPTTTASRALLDEWAAAHDLIATGGCRLQADLLPPRGEMLPAHATIDPAELRRVFARAKGTRGYRRLDLPFLTLTQFWRCHTYEPEDETIQAVVNFLQDRWEEFTQRDVGIYIDLPTTTAGGGGGASQRAPRAQQQSADASMPNAESVGEEASDEAEAEAVLWLVASRAAAAAQPLDGSASLAGKAAVAEPRPSGQAAAASDGRRASGGMGSAAPGAVPSGWSSSRSSESARGSGGSSPGAEEVL